MARPKSTPELRPSARNAASDEYVSQFHIDPSLIDTEEWHFAWVVTHCMNQETQDVSNALRLGYEPVRSSDFEDLQKRSQALRAIMGRGNDDPYVRQGDQILMKCPIAIFRQRQERLRTENANILKRVDMAAGGDFRGAPTFVKEAKQTRTTEPAFAPDN